MKSEYVVGGIGVAIIGILIVGNFQGCHTMPYDKPEFITISPSQTAFVFPLEGKTSDQRRFRSEDYLRQNMVASKRVEIPHRWVQQGYDALFRKGEGQYVPTVQAVVVERKPITREWTSDEQTGTSERNQGIEAESKESIGFRASMNCTAQIDEDDAPRYLYRYNDKTLNDVMDTEIRARIQGKFVEQCAHYDLSTLLVNKDKIMKSVRDDVLPYFKERGITITVLDMQGQLGYVDPEIQKAINLKFTSAQERKAQEEVNAKEISKAQALAKAGSIMSSPGAQSYLKFQVQMRQTENQATAISKWKGDVPQAVGAGGFFGLPFTNNAR